MILRRWLEHYSWLEDQQSTECFFQRHEGTSKMRTMKQIFTIIITIETTTWYYVKSTRNVDSEKSEPQMGFEPTTLCDLVRCSNHWATGDSVVSKVKLWVWLEPHHAVLYTIIWFSAFSLITNPVRSNNNFHVITLLLLVITEKTNTRFLMLVLTN